MLFSCPKYAGDGSDERIAFPVWMTKERCFERLRFASLTNDQFKNGCYRCQTGMIRAAEGMMK